MRCTAARRSSAFATSRSWHVATRSSDRARRSSVRGWRAARGGACAVRREPIGVVAGIVPCNFPLLLAVWKLGPALAAGNCVVMKPDEKTPLTLLALARVAHEAGLPRGVLNVVTGAGAEVGARLVAHP